MVEISSKSEVFDFSEGFTIIKRSWNDGNLSYLVANKYVLNFIEIEGIWIFRWAETHYLRGVGVGVEGGGLHLTCDAHFQTRVSYSSQKSCAKIWFGLVEIEGMLIFGGLAKAPY